MPTRRFPALLLAVLAPLTLAAAPASAQDRGKDFLFGEQEFRNACPPGLKYAAGACVPRCPSGFEDNGRTCRFRPYNR